MCPLRQVLVSSDTFRANLNNLLDAARIFCQCTVSIEIKLDLKIKMKIRKVILKEKKLGQLEKSWIGVKCAI